MEDMTTERLADHWWWRPGWRPGRRMYAWHFTFGDQPAVAKLAAGYQDRLAGLPGLDPVPARWLHLTIQDVGFTDDVPDCRVTVALKNARRRLAGSAPARVTIGPAHVVTESVVLKVEPVDGLTAIRAGLRAAITDAMPDRAPPGSAGWWPHISVAYSSATGPAAPYAAALAGSDGSAEVLLTAVSLIVLGRDHRRYEWTVRDIIGLGQT
jgi:2'-5' RNA ligase